MLQKSLVHAMETEHNQKILAVVKSVNIRS